MAHACVQRHKRFRALVNMAMHFLRSLAAVKARYLQQTPPPAGPATGKPQVATEVAAAAASGSAAKEEPAAAGTAPKPALGPTPAEAAAAAGAKRDIPLGGVQDDDDGPVGGTVAGADGKAHLEGVARLANELQPKGSTLGTAQVLTRVRS